MPRAKPREEPQEGRRRPAKKSGMGPFIPFVVAVVVLGGAMVAIMTGRKNKEAPPVETVKKSAPFADLPPEEPPAKKGSGSSGRTFVADAPDGLANNETWQKAVRLASEGEALFDEALAAKAESNTALLNEKGRAARDKLTEAVELTAAWEEELLEKYGDANTEVRRIMKVRSGWIDKMRWLHKSVAR